MVEKAAARARKETAVARAEDEIARKRAFVERFGAKNTKATQAQSRLKQIERIEVEELADSSRRAPALRFVPERPSGREVLELAGVSKSYGDNHVLTNVSLTVRRGERVGIIGPNGLGKSTLLKIAVERLDADAGRVRWGHEVRARLLPAGPPRGADRRRGHAARRFSRRRARARARPSCAASSGACCSRARRRGKKVAPAVGRRVRAPHLRAARPSRSRTCSSSTSRPTTSTSRPSTPLVEALKQYTGTLIFVSHDRWFVSELATRIIELTPAGPNDFPGTYAEYLARCGDDHLDGDAVVLKAKRARAETTAAGDDGGSAAPDRRPSPGRSRSAAATARRSCPSCATR